MKPEDLESLHEWRRKLIAWHESRPIIKGFKASDDAARKAKQK